MNSIDRQLPEEEALERERLRHYGLVMALAWVIIGALLLWRAKAACLVFFLLAGWFLAPALFAPGLLAPVERIWMRFAGRLSAVTTFVILTAVYFLMITPMALILRLLGKDLLALRPEPGRKSYWQPVEENGPGSRPFKPF